MKSRDIVRQRMYNQHLWGAPLESPQVVVKWLVAVQSQEYPVAKWSVAQRADGVTEAAMERAFADGAILRTHILRPTWHFVSPEDIRWMLRLTAPRVHTLNAHYYRNWELDDKLFARANALIVKALRDCGPLTRKELAATLDRAGISASGPRLGYILMQAELEALVCSGARQGKQQTYALLDDRAPQAESLDRDEAVAELTGRYFTSHGPATLKDYLWWSSLTAADGRTGLDAVRSKLEHEVVDGRTYWFAASSPGAKAALKVIDLVQGYDECIVSYSESKDVLFGLLAVDAIPDGSVAFTHAVLLNGQLIGHWRPVHERHSVVVKTFLHRPLDRLEARALDAAVERYGRFMGFPARLADA
jgi:hypothetical protein